MGSEATLQMFDLKLQAQGEPEIVKPAEPTDNKPIYLSNIDKVVVIPVETVYFYPANPEKSTDTLVSTLRDALAKVLVPYYFLAGRLSLNSSTGRLEIDCNAAGAQLSHYKSELSLSDLGDVTAPNPLFRNLVPTKFNAATISEVPLWALQITEFKDGSFTLGYMMSHTVFDGIGAIDFFANFTSLAKGGGVLFHPHIDRTVLKARDPPTVTFPHPEYIDISNIPGAGANVSPFTTNATAQAEFVALAASQKYQTRFFPFTPEIIETLKKKALADGTVKRASTFDVVSAHLWQCRTKAIEMPDAQPAPIMCAVDIRQRVIPPLPEHYAGNAVFSAYASITAKELRDASFPFVVAKVQEAITNINNDYIRSGLDWGELHVGVPALFGGIFMSAWWKMPFYDIDLGWGKPIYAGPIVTPLVEFVQLLSNGKQDGGLNAVIALEPLQMAKFEEYIKL